MRPWFAATVLLTSTLLSGCAVGPTYHRPVVQLPAITLPQILAIAIAQECAAFAASCDAIRVRQR
jgi:hypothetical protein